MDFVLFLYFLVLLVLCTYGAHRAHLVYLWLRYSPRVTEVTKRYQIPDHHSLPTVTVQLPLYNEATVVERLLNAVARIDYPRDRLEIQVLDDSTDETRLLAARKVALLRQQGLNIEYVRRPNRAGYKAGALEYGLKTAKGELIALFDADFIPQPEFLMSIVGHFHDPKVALVQTRWAHINRDESMLTGVQALLLDGHHLVENQARFGSGRLFNFAGTGGVWRRQAIADAGGWQHDTLTEDLDLSYRAQLRGWKFIYRPDVATPAELPHEMTAFRAQQYRWARGTVQTARKLLPTILRSHLSFSQRLEAFFHLTPHVAYPAMLALSVLILPAVLFVPVANAGTMLLVDLPLCTGATGSIAGFFVLAERAQGRSAWQAIRRLPAVIALGAGLSPLVTRAAWEGLRCMAGEFVRTPKRGSGTTRYRQRAKLPWTEYLLGTISACSVVASIHTGHYFATPFTCLFAFGYWYVAVHTTLEQLSTREEVPRLITSS
jgi:cellulose synthase/poly-beta-1,6-N-acetylglucosamine synthase-like glycosyltransferase